MLYYTPKTTFGLANFTIEKEQNMFRAILNFFFPKPTVILIKEFSDQSGYIASFEKHHKKTETGGTIEQAISLLIRFEQNPNRNNYIVFTVGFDDEYYFYPRKK